MALGALDLLHDDELLAFLVVGHREGRAAMTAQCRVALLHCLLDVLRVVVGAADNDHILDAPGDEQLAALIEKTEIAGPQPRAVFLPGDPRPENCLGLVRIAPIALRNIGAGHPDLADAAVRKPLSAVGIDDRDFLARERAAA